MCGADYLNEKPVFPDDIIDKINIVCPAVNTDPENNEIETVPEKEKEKDLPKILKILFPTLSV
jgi:hypothetical protein